MKQNSSPTRREFHRRILRHFFKQFDRAISGSHQRKTYFPPPHVLDDVFPQDVDSKPRTKGGIIGFSDGEDEHSDTDESIDIADIKPNVKFLPLMDWHTDSTICSRNSCGRENVNRETNLSFYWTSCWYKPRRVYTIKQYAC